MNNTRAPRPAIGHPFVAIFPAVGVLTRYSLQFPEEFEGATHGSTFGLSKGNKNG